MSGLIAALVARRARLRGHLQARGRRGGDRGGRGDRQRRLRAARPARWPRCARDGGAALVLMHTRVEPKGTLLDPGDLRRTWWPRSWRSCATRIEVALAAGVAAEQLILDPGPDFAKTPAQTVAVLRRAGRCCARSGGRCCWPSRARTSSARSPAGAPRRARRRDAGRARLGASTRAPSILRVHDVAGARATTSRCAPCCAASGCSAPLEGLSPERYPGRRAAAPLARLSGRFAGR